MPLSVPHTFVAQTKAKASEVNANFDAVENYTGAIPVGDLADGTAGQLIICNASGVPTYVTPTGALTLTSAGVNTLTCQEAAASASLTIGTSAADIVGATVTITNAAFYLVHAIFDFSVDAGTTVPSTCQAIGHLIVNGVAQSKVANLVAETAAAGASNTVRASVAQQWIVGVSAAQVIKLQASRFDTGSTGAATAFSGNTCLTCLRLS